MSALKVSIYFGIIRPTLKEDTIFLPLLGDLLIHQDDQFQRTPLLQFGEQRINVGDLVFRAIRMKTFANKYQPFTLRVPIDFLATVTL